jgi:hypothetical protein
MATQISTIHEELTALEIQEARRYLEQARDNVFAATIGLSQKQWAYRPTSGGWSIAEVVEHTVAVQERVLGPVSQALAESPESVGTDSQTIEEIIRTKFVDRSHKFKAPEFIQPTGQWTRSEALQRLATNTARLIERLESTPHLRRHRIPSPPLSATTGGQYTTMDGYQWILAAAAHTDRHAGQMMEIKAEPGFPVN